MMGIAARDGRVTGWADAGSIQCRVYVYACVCLCMCMCLYVNVCRCIYATNVTDVLA